MNINQKQLSILTVVILSTFIGLSSSYPEDLIAQFLSSKYLHHAFILSCDDPREDIRLQNDLMSSGIGATVFFINAGGSSLQVDQGFLMMQALEVDFGAAWILSAKCLADFQLITQMFNRDIFLSWHQWLIIFEDQNTTVDHLSDFPLSMDSEVTVAQQIHGDNSWKLLQVYKVDGQILAETRGAAAKYDSRRDLGWMTLNASVVISGKIPAGETLEQFLRDDQNLNENSFGKNVFALLEMMASIYKFRISLTRTRSWGYVTNGSFDGMLGVLQRGEADLALSPVYFREERLQISEVIAETTYQNVVIMFLDEGHSSGSWGAFLSPIESSAWRAAAVCIVLGALAIWMCSRLHLRLQAHRNPDVTATTGDACLTALGTVCQQGVSELCSLPSSRLSLLSLMLFSFLFYQFYSASIVSSLLRQPPRAIRTPEDFLASSMQLVAEDIIYNRVLLKTSTINVIKQLYQRKLLKGPLGGFVSVRDGVLLMQRGGCGFLVDITDVHQALRTTFSMRQLCQLAQLQLLAYKLISVVKKKSHFKQLLTFGYRKLFERGIAAKESLRWHLQPPRCVPELAGAHTDGLGPERLISAFVVLGIGALLAVLLLLIEIAVAQRQRARNKII